MKNNETCNYCARLLCQILLSSSRTHPESRVAFLEYSIAERLIGAIKSHVAILSLWGILEETTASTDTSSSAMQGQIEVDFERYPDVPSYESSSMDPVPAGVTVLCPDVPWPFFPSFASAECSNAYDDISFFQTDI